MGELIELLLESGLAIPIFIVTVILLVRKKVAKGLEQYEQEYEQLPQSAGGEAYGEAAYEAFPPTEEGVFENRSEAVREAKLRRAFEPSPTPIQPLDVAPRSMGSDYYRHVTSPLGGTSGSPGEAGESAVSSETPLSALLRDKDDLRRAVIASEVLARRG